MSCAIRECRFKFCHKHWNEQGLVMTHVDTHLKPRQPQLPQHLPQLPQLPMPFVSLPPSGLQPGSVTSRNGIVTIQ